jgi:hypothetical protein
MKYRNVGILAAVLCCALAWTLPARAQPMQVVPSCGSITLAPGMGANGTIDTTGRVCGNSGPGGVAGGVTLIPSAAPSAGIVSIETTALANNLVLKTSSGNMYSVYSTNLTGGASGFLQLFNGTAVPADGAVAGCTSTPTTGCLIDCAPFNSGVAQITNGNMPPSVYGFGIVAVVSSATTCTTKTTGVLTAWIVGKVM